MLYKILRYYFQNPKNKKLFYFEVPKSSPSMKLPKTMTELKLFEKDLKHISV